MQHVQQAGPPYGTMQEQSAGELTLRQSGPHARRVSQQTLLPQLRRPSLGSLPRLPTTTFAPYRKQNPVWDLYPILGSLKTSTRRSEDRKKPLQPIAETAPHDTFWREEPAVTRTVEPPKRSYVDAAGNKVQICMPAVQKKSHHTGR